MKAIKQILLIISAGCIFAACHKDPPSSIKFQGQSYYWSKYIGTYDVYDTVNHIQWVMKISHVGAHSNNNGGNEDSVLIENFANKFTIKNKWRPTYDNTVNSSAFDLGVYHPIIDNYGHSWHLDSEYDTTAPPNRPSNVLINDTIHLYYQQSNIAYYIQEGQPYYACFCKNIAVKRH